MKHMINACFLIMSLLTAGISSSYADEQEVLSTTIIESSDQAQEHSHIGTESVPCADIIVRDIAFKLLSTTLNNPAAIQPEDTMRICGIVENVGNADYTKDFDVQVLWGTTTIASQSVSGLSAGGTLTIEAEKTFLCEHAEEVAIKIAYPYPTQGGTSCVASATSSVDEFNIHGNLLPDLAVHSISLVGHNVHLTVENKGQGMIPSGKAMVHVFIDGKLQGGFGSSYFDSLAFRRPGGRKGVNTGLSISGTHTIMTVIDPEPFNLIQESDEGNNTATATLIALASTHDLFITDIEYSPEHGIVPVVSNQGSVGYAPETMIKVNIKVNKQQVSAYTYTIDTKLEPGMSVKLFPPVRIGIEKPSRVLVQVEPIPEDIDDENINNSMEKKVQM